MVILLSLLLVASAFGAEGDWTLLFNGRNLDGWMWSNATPAPVPCWKVTNGLLQTAPGDCVPTYLLTRESFEDFELTFEWKSQRGGNSGVKYRFQGYWVNKELRQVHEGPERIEPVALEYQIIDDEAHPDALTGPTHSAAAVYEYWAPKKEDPAKPNVWHTSRIIARGLHVEHWLDGKKVVDIELDSPEVQESFAKSRRRGSSPVLAKHERRSSPIALQFHDGEVWFRNVKIRRYSK